MSDQKPANQPAQSPGHTQQLHEQIAHQQTQKQLAGEPQDVRVSIRLSPEAKAALDEIMARGKIKTIQEAVRRSIGDELFLLKERSEGWAVVLKKGSRYRELKWPEAV